MADEGFLQRWSRRKAEARTPAKEPAPAQDSSAVPEEAAPAPDPQAAAPAGRAPAEDDDEAIDLDALPDIDSLTYESDFTVFMRKGVPPELRRRALQRLWRSNPTLANLDGLVEYGEDYTKIGTSGEVVRTAYQVGRGMLERIEPTAASAGRAAARGAARPAPDQPASASPPAAEGPAAELPAGVATDETRPRGSGEQQAAPAPDGDRAESDRSAPVRKPRRLPRRG